MENLIEYIAKSLVDDPEQVRVSRRNAGSSIIVELRVAQEDTGRVIGKGGHVANAMRSLLKVYEDGPKARRIILKIM